MWEKEELRAEAADDRGLLHVPLEQHLCGAGERRAPSPALQMSLCHHVSCYFRGTELAPSQSAASHCSPRHKSLARWPHILGHHFLMHGVLRPRTGSKKSKCIKRREGNNQAIKAAREGYRRINQAAL